MIFWIATSVESWIEKTKPIRTKVTNYTEYYKFTEKSCTYWNCPIHFGNFKKNIPWERRWCLLGEPLSHPKVIKTAKLRKMKKLVDYSTASLMSLELCL